VLGLDEGTGIVGHNLDFVVFGEGSATVVTDGATAQYPRGAGLAIDLLAGSRDRLTVHGEGHPALPTGAFELEPMPPVLAVNGINRS
jgi:hypothetical protein